MGVHSTHFVEETLNPSSVHILVYAVERSAHLGNAGYHVANKTLNRPQTSDMLPASLPHSEGDLVALVALDQPDVHVHMSDVLRKSSSGSSDSDES